MATDLPVPPIGEVDLSAVLSALADPLRRAVVADLLARPDGEHACASFDLPVTKSTRTHHWRVLRQAGLITQRDAGNGSYIQLRRHELGRTLPRPTAGHPGRAPRLRGQPGGRLIERVDGSPGGCACRIGPSRMSPGHGRELVAAQREPGPVGLARRAGRASHDRGR